MNGFSMMCAVASAAESVIVIMKSVATKPSRDQNEELAFPARQQMLQHRDRAFAVRTFLGDAIVDWQSAEEGEENEE